MAGPWEKYAQASPPPATDDGPWAKYNGAAASAPAPREKIPDAEFEKLSTGDGTLGNFNAGAEIPVLGPAVTRAGHAFAAGVESLLPDSVRGDDYKGKSFSELYQRLEQDDQAKAQAFAKEHPVVDAAAKLGGAAVLPLPPTFQAAEGAGALARTGVGLANAGTRVGANTAISAADAYARAKPGQDPLAAAGDAAKRAATIGGGLELLGAGAGALSKLGGPVGEGLEAAGAAAKGAAEEKAFKAAVGNQAKPYNDAAARGVINERGRELLDEGVVGFGDSAQQIATKALAAKRATGDEIGGLLRQLDEQGAKAGSPGLVSGKAMADELRSYAAEIGGSGNKSLIARLNEAAQDLEERGNMTFAEAQVEKNSWNWEPGSSVSKIVARRVKGIIGDEMEGAVGRIGASPAPAAAAETAAPAAAVTHTDPFAERLQTGTGRTVAQPAAAGAVLRDAEAVPAPGAAPAEAQAQYQDLKSRYGTMAAAAKDAQVNANRYAKNNSASLGDKAAAAAAMIVSPHGTAGKVATGVVAGLANKLIRKRGASAGAVGLDRIGDMLQATPEAFGKYAGTLLDAMRRGPQSLAVTHYLLMQQDPDYQQLVGGHGDTP